MSTRVDPYVILIDNGTPIATSGDKLELISCDIAGSEAFVEFVQLALRARGLVFSHLDQVRLGVLMHGRVDQFKRPRADWDTRAIKFGAWARDEFNKHSSFWWKSSEFIRFLTNKPCYSVETAIRRFDMATGTKFGSLCRELVARREMMERQESARRALRSMSKVDRDALLAEFQSEEESFRKTLAETSRDGASMTPVIPTPVVRLIQQMGHDFENGRCNRCDSYNKESSCMFLTTNSRLQADIADSSDDWAVAVADDGSPF